MSKTGRIPALTKFIPSHLSSQNHTIGAAKKDAVFTTNEEIWEFFLKVELFVGCLIKCPTYTSVARPPFFF